MDPKTLQTWLPLLVIVVVFAFRFRNLKTARPFRPAGLWVAPVLLSGVFAVMLFAMPPTPLGWALMTLGLGIGAAIGWKRGHLMHLEREPGSGRLMIRQSPAALFLILAILVGKRALAAGLGADPGASEGGHIAPTAMLATDGLLGFALGMVVMLRWTLWQRVKSVPLHQA